VVADCPNGVSSNSQDFFLNITIKGDSCQSPSKSMLVGSRNSGDVCMVSSSGSSVANTSTNGIP
jgi:hypothetical protein